MKTLPTSNSSAGSGHTPAPQTRLQLQHFLRLEPDGRSPQGIVEAILASEGACWWRPNDTPPAIRTYCERQPDARFPGANLAVLFGTDFPCGTYTAGDIKAEALRQGASPTLFLAGLALRARFGPERILEMVNDLRPAGSPPVDTVTILSDAQPDGFSPSGVAVLSVYTSRPAGRPQYDCGPELFSLGCHDSRPLGDIGATAFLLAH